MTAVMDLFPSVGEAINDGDFVHFGGFAHLIPFAAGHEIIRQEVSGLTISRLAPDLLFDQLLAAGCAESVVFSYAGNLRVGRFHAFRWALVDFDPVALPPTGTVAAVTTIERGGEPPEFATQQAASGSYAAALAKFEHEGNAVSIPLQAADTGTPLSIGDNVRKRITRLYEQEGVIRYARNAWPDPT